MPVLRRGSVAPPPNWSAVDHTSGPGHRLAEVERTAGQAITHHGFRRRISAPADDDAVITLLPQIGPVPPEYSSELVVYTIST